MLPLPELLFAPDFISFTRYKKLILPHRLELTCAPVRVDQVTIADSAAIQCFSPIRVRPDYYQCFLYQWTYEKQQINVCLVIAPSLPKKKGDSWNCPSTRTSRPMYRASRSTPPKYPS